jgi:hypothetical protein
VPAYSLSFSLTFCLEKFTFGLLNIEFIKPLLAFRPVHRGNSAAVASAVRGLAPRAPELEIPRLARGAGPMGDERKRGLVEGFRVLTLLYRVSELPAGAFQRLVELFKAYRAVGALYWWSKRLNLEEGVELALERVRQLPSYYRRAFDEESRVYQFSEV